MESQGVNDFVAIQIEAVKLIVIVGDKGGIDGLGRLKFWLLLRSAI